METAVFRQLTFMSLLHMELQILSAVQILGAQKLKRGQLVTTIAPQSSCCCSVLLLESSILLCACILEYILLMCNKNEKRKKKKLDHLRPNNKYISIWTPYHRCIVDMGVSSIHHWSTMKGKYLDSWGCTACLLGTRPWHTHPAYYGKSIIPS